MNEQQEEFKGKADVERYIAKLRADMLADATIRKYRSHMGLMLGYIKKHPRDITLEDVDQWRYEMVVNRKYEPETMWANAVIIRKFMRFLGKSEIAEKMVMPKRPEIPPPEKEIWLLPEEEKAMIEKSRQSGVRQHAMIRLFLSTGIRPGELGSLDLSDVDLEQRLIHIRHGKGNKYRVVPIDTQTKDAILEYLKYRECVEDAEPLFTSNMGKRLSRAMILRDVTECAILAGITKRITPHKLRHTFITMVIERTKDIPLAQKLAGHTKIKTTMRYHHSTHEEMVAKYRKFFDSACAIETSIPKPSSEEILKTLDVKFLNGEIPYQTYIELKNKYQSEGNNNRKSDKYDAAYI